MLDHRREGREHIHIRGAVTERSGDRLIARSKVHDVSAKIMTCLLGGGGQCTELRKQEQQSVSIIIIILVNIKDHPSRIRVIARQQTY